MKHKKIVITYGTYDLSHIGHIRFLKKAKKLGDYLIVAVSTDEFNKIKNKKAIFPYKHRREIISMIKGVDKVIPEKNWEQKIGDVKKYKVDVFCIGDDWRGKFDELKKYCKVVYLPRTKNISTTQIRQRIKHESNNS